MAEPLYRKVEAEIRSLIAGGAFAEGALIPPVRELAERFGTNVFTVHKALGPLEREGLIQRRRKLGTVVTKGSPKLACVGLYFASSFIYDDEMAFYRRLCERLVGRLDALGWGHRLWTETLRPGDSRVKGSQVQAIEEAAAKGLIQGLIAPMTNSPAFDAFINLKTPSAFMSSGEVERNVSFDFESFFRLALGRLKSQGCRSAGLISNIYGKEVASGKGASREYVQFHKLFRSVAGELGLAWREDWVSCPETGVIPQSQLRFGYEAFGRLWSQSERPDGLIAYSDIAARGAATAILERRVDVPRELKLVFHRNKGVETLCPLACSWAESDTQEVAEKLVELVRLQASGREIEPQRVGFRLAD
jgi:DNA-binding transcriptional regulator YhcF (GntR family)/DNA-binding LacI/PurR family transcriptional regulator